MPRQHKEIFDSVRRRTDMWVQPATYQVVAAFVQGYDIACEGGVLTGFKEWLVLRVRSGTNLHWTALVLDLAFPNVASPEAALTSAETHRHAIDTLFNMIEEFDNARSEFDGLNKIIVAYDQWVRARDAAADIATLESENSKRPKKPS